MMAPSGMIFALALALASCAPRPPPGRKAPRLPVPPEFVAAPSAPASVPEVPVPSDDLPSPEASAGPAAAPPPPVADPQPPPEPEVVLYLETPYKLDARPPPTSQAAYKADIMDRREWNRGGTGALAAPLPGVEGHPDPRVIVNVDDVSGPLSPKGLVRTARKYHWINVVRCYRLGAYKDRHLRGWTRGEMTIGRNGRVSRARLRDTELADEDVARCLIDKLRAIDFPSAGGATTASVAIRVGPGDEPMPPPKDLIVPGDGTLSLEAMRAGVEAGRDAILECYRAAFAYAPGLWGRIILRFAVSARGATTEAFEAGSRFPDARTTQCIVRAARNFAFSRPDGGDIRFVVPIRLWREGADVARPDPPRDRDLAEPRAMPVPPEG
ncbi:MAG: AgmX/PglI C-terminal domain-containing protein [Myxococcota bacterium]